MISVFVFLDHRRLRQFTVCRLHKGSEHFIICVFVRIFQGDQGAGDRGQKDIIYFGTAVPESEW